MSHREKLLWKDKTKKQKTKTVLGTVFLSLFTVGTALSFVFAGVIFGEDSVFNRTLGNSVVTTLFQSIPAVIRSVQIIVIALLVSILGRMLLRKGFARGQRGITIVKLVDSFVKYVIAIIAVLGVLSAWGVNTTTLLASVGILGLVVGLGAQSLIADIIAGVFIVFEGEYQVGDIVVIDGWRGTVEEIGIRTTKIIDASGNIKIVNNSEIKTVVNQTKELSLAVCEVGIEYGESIERVEAVIHSQLDNIRANIPAIVDGPYYKGVTRLGTSSVDLLFMAKCKEEDLYQTQRDLNREIKLIFDKHNINIPFPQIVLNQPVELNARVSAKTQKEAREFVEEQKTLSKDLEDEK